MASTNVSFIPQAMNSSMTRKSQGDFLINDFQNYICFLFINYVLLMPIQFFGISANLINIVVFLNTGLSDSLTVTLFGLSIADFFTLIGYLAARVLHIYTKLIDMESQIHVLHTYFVATWYSTYFVDVSMYLTVFSAVQKCCCVALPFRFKDIFTKKTGIVGTLAIYAMTLGVILPVLSSIKFQLRSNVSASELQAGIHSLHVLPHYDVSVSVWRFVNRFSLTIAGQLTIIVCLVVIVVVLQTSATFRQSSQNSSADQGNFPIISSNELRAIRAVQVLSYIFVVTKIPATVLSMITEFVAIFSTAYYYNLRTLIVHLAYFAVTINASINICVYIRYNRKFKAVFLDIFDFKRRRNKSDTY